MPGAAAATGVTYWHGGGHVDGDLLVPQPAASTRSGEPDGWLYITTSRDLAATYAATADGRSWLYEVEPLSDVERDPGSLFDYSLRTRSARIVRRFTISNRERDARRRSVARFF